MAIRHGAPEPRASSAIGSTAARRTTFSMGGFVSTTETYSVKIRDDGHGARVVVFREAGVLLTLTGDHAARLADVADRAAQIAITGDFPEFYVGGPDDDDPPGGVHIVR